MSDLVIEARDLKKVYRLYAGPGYRFLDMFGMLGRRPGAYTEHAALDGVSLEIRRGEKVAIIGRNGAGKSTLLKLITRVIEPSSGTLDVKGQAHALLQIGTGFHPDFTGRQNVFAYLAQLGVVGRQAESKYLEIVDFAELEEYIDQPVKTYSTGMSVRLMFSTATVIVPELLVLDEVLGVGDAYFASKSYQRMRDLCDHQGTTLLLVTHDIYSAVKMCNRVIWVDRGRILMDGAAAGVVKAYEDSIRQQEEHRLRLKKRQKLKELTEAEPVLERPNHVLLEVASRNGRPQHGLVYFSDVQLLVKGQPAISLSLGADGFADEFGTHMDSTGTAWGKPVERHGRLCRPMLNYGTPFHKVAGVFAIPGIHGEPSADDVGCSIDYSAPEGCDLVVRLFVAGREWELGAIKGTCEGWAKWVGTAASAQSHQPQGTAVNTTGVHGTGAFAVRNARFVSEDGVEAHTLKHGAPALLEIDYTIKDPQLQECAQVVIALHKDGVHDVCRFIGRNLFFDSVLKNQGTIRLTIPRLTLTDGTYSVTIMIAKAGYYDTNQTVFYTINPDVHCCVSRLFDVSVTASGLLGSGTLHVCDGLWSLE